MQIDGRDALHSSDRLERVVRSPVRVIKISDPQCNEYLLAVSVLQFPSLSLRSTSNDDLSIRVKSSSAERDKRS